MTTAAAIAPAAATAAIPAVTARRLENRAGGAARGGRVTSAVRYGPAVRSAAAAGRAAAASRSLSGASSNAIVVSSALPAADAQRSAQLGSCPANQPWSCRAASSARSLATIGCHGSAAWALP
jgi:hypothetical protein